jgi:hypothetical protein
MGKPKVFCIGWHKTGTTSIGDALRQLGYQVGGWDGVDTGRLIFRWHEKRFVPIVKRAEKFDALEDLPWPLVYEQMDEAFPGSKFILTVRRDDATWLRSLQSHLQKAGRWVGHYLIYQSYDPIRDAEAHLTRYQNHNQAVRKYFAGRENDLLEMCFENGDSWPELCRFLGESKIPRAPFPHSNKTPNILA